MEALDAPRLQRWARSRGTALPFELGLLWPRYMELTHATIDRACRPAIELVGDLGRTIDALAEHLGRLAADRLNPPQATRLQPLPTLRVWAR